MADAMLLGVAMPIALLLIADGILGMLRAAANGTVRDTIDANAVETACGLWLLLIVWRAA